MGSINNPGFSTFIRDPLLWFCLAVTLFLSITVLYYRNVHSTILKTFHISSSDQLIKIIDKANRESKRWKMESDHFSETVVQQRKETQQIEKITKDLRKEQDELRMEYEIQNDDDNDNNNNNAKQLTPEEMEKLKQREQAWKKQVFLLQNSTQRESKREATEQ